MDEPSATFDDSCTKSGGAHYALGPTLDLFLRLKPCFDFVAGCCIFVDKGIHPDATRQIVEDWVREFHGDRHEAERAFNHRHMRDLTSYYGLHCSAERLREFAEVWAAIVLWNLKTAFPEIHFELSIEADEQLDDWIVTFWSSGDS